MGGPSQGSQLGSGLGGYGGVGYGGPSMSGASGYGGGNSQGNSMGQGMGMGYGQQNPFMGMMQQLQRNNMGGGFGMGLQQGGYGQQGRQDLAMGQGQQDWQRAGQQMPQNPWDPRNMGIPQIGAAGDQWARNPNGGQFYNQTLWNQMQNAQQAVPQPYQGDPNYSPATEPPANAWSPGGMAPLDDGIVAGSGRGGGGGRFRNG